jgi:hypothetical protein
MEKKSAYNLLVCTGTNVEFIAYILMEPDCPRSLHRQLHLRLCHLGPCNHLVQTRFLHLHGLRYRWPGEGTCQRHHCSMELPTLRRRRPWRCTLLVRLQPLGQKNTHRNRRFPDGAGGRSASWHCKLCHASCCPCDHRSWYWLFITCNPTVSSRGGTSTRSRSDGRATW